MNIQKIKIEIKNIFSAFLFLWMKKVLSAITILAILFSNLVIPSFNIVYASPLQDNNDWTWQDSYTDELWISDQSNVITSEWSVSLSACDGSISNWSFTTTPITPRSFSSWKKLEIDWVFGNSTLPSIDILDKDGSIIVSHNDVNSIIDISGIEAYLYPTIKVRINFNYSSSEACPSITNMKITFEPESVVITDISAPESIDAGNNLVYRLRNSVNYVSAKWLVIFAELPQLSGSENNVVLPDWYTSSPNPTFVSATQWWE